MINNDMEIFPRSSEHELAPNIRRQVGGRALVFEAGNADRPLTAEYSSCKLEGFNHLFPASAFRDDPRLLLDETKTAEGAGRLIGKLPDDSPYKDFARTELALHHAKANDTKHAEELMNTIIDIGATIHVLCQIIRYEKNKQRKMKLESKLYGLFDQVITEYNEKEDVHTANAIAEISGTFPEDKDIRTYAEIVLNEQPVAILAGHIESQG